MLREIDEHPDQRRQHVTHPGVRVHPADLERVVDTDVPGHQRLAHRWVCRQQAPEPAVARRGAAGAVHGGAQVAGHRTVLGGEHAPVLADGDQRRPLRHQAAQLELVRTQTIVERRIGRTDAFLDEGGEHVEILANIRSSCKPVTGACQVSPADDLEPPPQWRPAKTTTVADELRRAITVW